MKIRKMDRKAVSPVIAIVLLLMMTVAAAGAAYFWLTQMQSGIQEQSTKSIENIMQQSGRRLIAQAAICEPTVSDGMVGWWEFYEGEGNKTHDSSKNENTGTIHGANWTDGKAGGALDFDGTDDYVNCGDASSLRPTEELTVSAWIKTPDAYKHRGIVRYTTDIHSNGYHIMGDWDQSNELSFGIVTDADGEERIWIDIPLDEWVHITMTYDGSSFIVYKNGNQVGWESHSGSINYTDTNCYISRSGGDDVYWDGTIDEVRIYDKALSAEEINETYRGKMKVKITVRNIGSVEIPEAKFVANLKKDGTTVDSDTYTTTSSIDTDELKTLTFYFNEMRPGGSYNVNIPGIDVSQSVKCQSLE